MLAVISDRGELQSAQDYFPFGMAMPGRSNGAYRYGFNGKETDPETGIQDYGMRWYLPNIARFPSVDPITRDYPELTPYQFASNTPIRAIDLDGLESVDVNYVKEKLNSTIITAKKSNDIIYLTRWYSTHNEGLVVRAQLSHHSTHEVYGETNSTLVTCNAPCVINVLDINVREGGDRYTNYNAPQDWTHVDRKNNASVSQIQSAKVVALVVADPPLPNISTANVPVAPVNVGSQFDANVGNPRNVPGLTADLASTIGLAARGATINISASVNIRAETPFAAPMRTGGTFAGLAANRVQSVRAILIANGVNPAQITVSPPVRGIPGINVTAVGATTPVTTATSGTPNSAAVTSVETKKE